MYFKATFRCDDYTYHAYTEAYDRKEARKCVRDELLEYEKDDYMECITEISEQEYLEGVEAFGNGVRA